MRISRLPNDNVDYMWFPEAPKLDIDGWGAYTRYYRLSKTKGLKLGHNNYFTATDLAMYSILRRVFPKHGIRVPRIYGLAAMPKQTHPSLPKWRNERGDNKILTGYIVEHINIDPLDGLPNDYEDETFHHFCGKIEKIAEANGLEAWDVGRRNAVNKPKEYLIDLNSIRPDTPRTKKENVSMTTKILSILELIESNEKP